MKADIILKSDAIFDSMCDDPFPGFVAIAGNKIIGAGACDEGTKTLIDSNTKIYDFKNKLIIPGLHDSHVHLALASLYLSSVNLGAAKSEEESARMVAEFEKQHPTEGWIFGFNWYNFYWKDQALPTRKSLDAYFPDRPVFLMNTECHGIWVNSKALEICGIDQNTETPKGGTIHKDENGNPTGVLDEDAAGLVAAKAMDMPLELQLNYLRPFLEEMSAYGVTSLVDVQPLFGVEMSFLKAVKYLEDKDELPLRIHIAGNLFEDIAVHEIRRSTLSTDKVRFDQLKQFTEGIFPTHTCLLLEDYTDEPGNKGTVIGDLEKLEQCVMTAHQHGFSVKLHAQADKAVQLALNYYQKAIKKYGPLRHTIEHAELVDKADIMRFRQLDVVPSMQPEHLGLSPHWDNHEYRITLGDERAWRCWPVKSLLKSTGVVALGTDCPVVSENPYYQISRSIIRTLDNGEPEGGWNPQERLTVAEAIRSYTYGSAYGVGRENELGTIKVGNFADITVIDRDLFKIPAEKIREARSAMTIMDGTVRYVCEWKNERGR
ncbi:amidohydrolase [Eubacteriales bacterium DFI.9.88]|nr:amidohydrolase [Eubacteriales bacterium DFI.9.88]